MSNNDDEDKNSNDYEFDDNRLTKKKVMRTLGRRTYKRPISRKENINTSAKPQKDYIPEKSTNLSKQVKEKFLYLPYHPLPDLSDYLGDIIEVHKHIKSPKVKISAEYLSKDNKAFKERRLWGSDIYTSDSDPVSILQHSGYFKIKELHPTNIEGVSVYFRVSKGRTTYNSSLKNGIKSKKSNNYQGHSIKPENYSLLKHIGSKNELLEMASKIPFRSEYERKKIIPKKLSENLFYKDINFVFNCCNELWTEYSLPAISDKGREIKEYTSWKLKDKVIYIETELKRYEISRNVSDHTNDDYLFEEYETFRITEVKEPFDKDHDFMLRSVIPLSEENVDCVFSRFDWHELNWGENSLLIRNLEINNIKCFNFYNIK